MKLLKRFREEMRQVGCDNKVSSVRKNIGKSDSPCVKIYRQMSGFAFPNFQRGHNVPHHSLRWPHLVRVAVLAVAQDGSTQSEAQVESDLMFPPRHHLGLHEAGIATGSQHLAHWYVNIMILALLKNILVEIRQV